MTEDYPMLDLFEKTLDLVCIVSKEGWLKKVNPAVIKTLGYSEKGLFASPVSAYIHPDDRQRTASSRDDLLDNKPFPRITFSRISFQFFHGFNACQRM